MIPQLRRFGYSNKRSLTVVQILRIPSPQERFFQRATVPVLCVKRDDEVFWLITCSTQAQWDLGTSKAASVLNFYRLCVRVPHLQREGFG